MKEIYFAGGCFWGVEHFFKGVDGVVNTTPGYANGSLESPSYEQVYTDTTGHAETVKVEYNPEKVSLQQLTRLFFAIIDPQSLNRQGHDEGTRYRSGIFYADEADLPAIKEVFDRVPGKVVTELEPLGCFFPAEEYHADYLDKNPGGYCHLSLKTFRYLRLYQDLKLVLEGEADPITRMAQISAYIQERMGFFWTGFYRVSLSSRETPSLSSRAESRDLELLLGPFQGPPACMRIKYGRGVCGSAWKEKRTLVVPDVEEFPGHIACSAESRSEIVVPVIRGGEVTAVLDIDSKEIGTFDRTDAAFLEMIVEDCA
ncbi:MAG: peptide-methionine (S)-S-oxide reductase MsrA [Bacteroidales bacterium]|nr:peptide-methionine (S)-S-oxide reductase MsrA [Bacteroidales bacterium]